MRILALALAAALVAGCTGSSDGGDEPEKPPVQPTTKGLGILYGAVANDAIVPIPGAKVTLVGPEQATAEALTDANGEFAFNDLLPGPWVLTTTKAGYFEAQLPVVVEADRTDIDPVLIRMRADVANTPYSFTYTAEGLFSCAFGAEVPDVVSGTVPCGQPLLADVFPDDVADVNYTLDRMPEFVQAEVVWDGNQPVNNWMQVSIAYPTSDSAAHPDFWVDFTQQGPPPVVAVTMDDPAMLQEYLLTGWGLNSTDPPELEVRVFPAANDDTGPVLTAQQSFTVYTSVFYGYKPASGWLFSEEGERPLPP